jgi:WD40 repeat protein
MQVPVQQDPHSGQGYQGYQGNQGSPAYQGHTSGPSGSRSGGMMGPPFAPPPRKKRYPVVLASVAVLVVLALAAGGALWLKNHRGDADSDSTSAGAAAAAIVGPKPRIVRTLKGPTAWINTIAYSPDGKYVASGSGTGDTTIRLWDATTGAPVGKPLSGGAKSGTVFRVAFSLDSQWLAAASSDATRIYRVSDRQVVHILRTNDPKLPGQDDSDQTPYCVAFSPDRTTLATSHHNEKVHRWKINGAPIGNGKGYDEQGEVYAVAFSPDGKYLYSGGTAAFIRQWDVATGQQVGEAWAATGSLDVNSLAVSTDGTVAASYDDHAVRLWKAGSATPILTLRGHTQKIFYVAFSPDGRAVASASTDGTVRVWNASTGTPLATLPSGNGEYDAVAFSPDGKQLAAGGDGMVVQVWDLDVGGAPDPSAATSATPSAATSATPSG